MYVSVDVDLDPAEFYESLDYSEKRDVLCWLMDDGILPEDDESFDKTIENIKEQIYRLQYRGLDSEKSAVEILETILEKADRL